MKLLNTISCLESSEEELVMHNEEIVKLFERIISIKDFDCALLCKYQDEYHKQFDQLVKGCVFSEIWNETECFDFKNGIDLYLDEEGYLVMMIYGQGYEFNNKYHLIEMAVKIMPYDKNKKFIDVSSIVLHNTIEYSMSKFQYEYNPKYN